MTSSCVCRLLYGDGDLYGKQDKQRLQPRTANWLTRVTMSKQAIHRRYACIRGPGWAFQVQWVQQAEQAKGEKSTCMRKSSGMFLVQYAYLNMPQGPVWARNAWYATMIDLIGQCDRARSPQKRYMKRKWRWQTCTRACIGAEKFEASSARHTRQGGKPLAIVTDLTRELAKKMEVNQLRSLALTTQRAATLWGDWCHRPEASKTCLCTKRPVANKQQNRNE